MGKSKWTICLFVLFDILRWFEDIYLIQRLHHYRECDAKFWPLLSINGSGEIHVDPDYVDNSGDAAKIVTVISRAIAAK